MQSISLCRCVYFRRVYISHNHDRKSLLWLLDAAMSLVLVFLFIAFNVSSWQFDIPTKSSSLNQSHSTMTHCCGSNPIICNHLHTAALLFPSGVENYSRPLIWNGSQWHVHRQYPMHALHCHDQLMSRMWCCQCHLLWGAAEIQSLFAPLLKQAVPHCTIVLSIFSYLRSNGNTFHRIPKDQLLEVRLGIDVRYGPMSQYMRIAAGTHWCHRRRFGVSSDCTGCGTMHAHC